VDDEREGPGTTAHDRTRNNNDNNNTNRSHQQ